MRVARTQPPVGYRVAPGRVLLAACRTIAARHPRERFEAEIAEFCGVRNAFAVSSGKAALTLILLALARHSQRRKVIIPAYTCYSLPSAIVKAGLDVVPCDIAPAGFDYDYDRLSPMLQPDVLCVLSVHLFGVLADTKRLKALCLPRGIPVVEDAAQAFGARHDRGAAGSVGDVGFVSLGRGKNITCGAGGVVLTDSEPIATALRDLLERHRGSSVADDVRAFVTMLALSLFVTPTLYWLPAGLPFLRLGQTVFDTAFPVRRLSAFAALLLRGWQKDLDRLNAVRRANGAFYAARLPGPGAASNVPYLRFPIVLQDAAAVNGLVGQRGKELGISRMYPAPIDGIEELRGCVPGGPFPNAARLARGLVTLPTHPLLSAGERDEIYTRVSEMLARDRSAAAALAS